jgi:hypothetical protein
MRKHILEPKKSDVFIPISIAVLLIIGIFISIVQIQQPQQNKSNAQTALKNCDVTASELSFSASEKEMFDTINKYRKENGLNELYYHPTLQRAGQWMSNDMYSHKNLNHTDSLGRAVGTRLKDCGLTENSWGENISEGYQNVPKAFEAWKNSPGHNANMLGNFTHMGIAESNTFWTLDLAKVSNGTTSPPPLSGGITLSTIPTVQPGISVQPTSQPTSVPTIPVSPTSPNTRPDLIVSDMAISTNGNVCVPLGVLVTIKNIGGTVTLPVVVQANTGIGTIGGGIAAGETKTVWIQSIATGENIATVDPSSSITEVNEANNQLKRSLVNPTTAPRCLISPTTPTFPTSSAGRPTAPASLTPAPTTYPGFVLNPNDTQVLVSVKLPGIGINGNKTPKHLSRKVTVTVYDLENEQVVIGTAFLTYDKNDLFRGIVHLGKGINSTYYVKIGSDHTLQELVMPQFQPILNDRLNVLSPVVLIPGELTGDNQLTLTDYNMALACFQDKKCSVKPLSDANDDGTVNTYDSIDFNDDGKVNVVDYNFFLHNFKEFGGD